MFVLDTNTLIYFFKGMGNVSTRLLNIPPKDIGIPSIVVFELSVGIEKSTSPEKRKQQLATLVRAVSVLPFGLVEATHASQIRVDLERRGRPIGSYDVLIAATALAINATLVTHNTKEFNRIKQLTVEDWY